MNRFLDSAIGVMVVIAAALTSNAYADVIYNNLGPNNAYNNVNGFTVGNPFSVAAQFTAPDNMILTLVELGMHANFPDHFVDISIAPDDSGLPSASMTSLGATGVLPLTSDQSNPLVSVGGNGFQLLAGTSYWIVAAAASSNVWNLNSTLTITPVATKFAGDPWTSPGAVLTPAMRITAVVPEPASLGLLGLTSAALLAGRRRR